MPSNIDPTLCDAIRNLLFEMDTRPLLASVIWIHVRDKMIIPTTQSDVQTHLSFLESRGEVTKIANRDNPTIVSWTLTQVGRVRAVQS